MRVAVLRSSRFLPAAVEATRTRWPNASLAIVCQPGSETECQDRRVQPADVWLYDEAPAFRPGPWLRSRARRELLRWQPEAVVVQWSSADGTGHVLLGLTALLVRPRGFEAFRPDGTWVTVGARDLVPALLARWAVRARVPGLLSVTAIAVLTVAATPAWLFYRVRHRLGRTPVTG